MVSLCMGKDKGFGSEKSRRICPCCEIYFIHEENKKDSLPFVKRFFATVPQPVAFLRVQVRPIDQVVALTRWDRTFWGD